MKFRTEYISAKSNWDIQHGDSLFSIGSCFADCMGTKLHQFQFHVMANPFGVLYNPLSILGNLRASLKGPLVSKEEIIENKSTFYSYKLHSEICGATKLDLEKSIEELRVKVEAHLVKTDYILLTFGTAYVYELKSSGKTVANCHKMPSTLFHKRLITIDEIINEFDEFLKQIKEKKSSIKIIISVSPVRHTKDTLSLNTVSKSVLRLACHYLSENYHENVQYFPAFEILGDDLRDYRFYKEDLIHPTSQAEQYVWDKFSETFFNSSTLEINKKVSDIIAALQHRVMNSQSSDYQNFLKNIGEKLEILNAKVAVPRLITELALKLKA